MSQRPRFLSPDQLAQWRADDARQQAVKDAKAETLKAEFGEKFERTAEMLGVEDADVRALAADRMAVLLADRGSNPTTMEHRDYMDIADQAVGFAYGEDERRMAAEIEGAISDALKEDPGAARSLTEDVAPATPEREVLKTPDRPAEADPPLPVEQAPVRQVEATPERGPDGNPERPAVDLSADPVTAQREELLERQFAEYQAMRSGSNRDETRFEQLARRHEQELAAFERQQGGAPEADRSVAVDPQAEQPSQGSLAPDEQGRAADTDADRQPPTAQSPLGLPEDSRRDAQAGNEIGPGHEAERAPPDAANDVGEPPAEPAATPAAPDQAQPGSRRLRFYEDLKQEHATAVGRDDKADAKGEGGGKKLSFYEDHKPANGHNLDL